MKYNPYSKELDTLAYIVAIIAFIGLFVYIYISHCYGITMTDIIPPCHFHAVTGFYCPGCGGTRSVMHMLSGNFVKSLYYHPIVLYVTIPGIVFFISQSIYRIRRFFTRNSCKSSPEKYCYHVISIHPVYIYIGCALIILQWIIKNAILLLS